MGQRPRRNLCLIVAVLLGLPAVAAPCWASPSVTEDSEEEAEPVDRMVDSILVTAEKRTRDVLTVPVSMTVLDRDDLRSSAVDRVEDLTLLVPNLHYAEYADGQYRLAYRGIGAGGFSGNPTWNTVIDGVVVPYHRAFRLLDLDRVEILRGPQGTLYGRNTTSGLINVTTQLAASGPAVDWSYGSGDSWETKLAFGQSADRLTYRLAARAARSRGFGENAVLHRDDSQQQEDFTFRGTLAWALASGWNFKLSMTVDEYDNNADNLTRMTTPRVSSLPYFGTSEGDLTLPALTIERSWRNFTLTSISAYADAYRGVTFWLPVPGLRNGAQEDGVRSLSHELRLTPTAQASSRLDWLAGLYYLDEEKTFTALAFLQNGTPLVRRPSVTDVSSAAVFGEIRLTLDDSWLLTAGLRGNTEEQEVRWRNNAITASPERFGDGSWSTLLPKLALSYRPKETLHVYGSVSRGFRPGGFDVTNRTDIAFDPEYTTQYELGVKSLMTERALRLDMAAFYIDWTDLQIVRQVEIGVVQTDNAASARSTGLELEATWMPDPGLEFRFFGGYTDAEFTEYRPRPGLDFGGKTIIHVPEHSLGISARYASSTRWSAAVDLVHNGEIQLDEANTIQQAPYEVLNARLAYQAKSWTLALVGKNLLDEDYLTRGFEFGGVIGYFAEPLTVGLEFHWQP